MATPAKQLARSGGISYQELIAQDVVPPPRTLTLESPYDGFPVIQPFILKALIARPSFIGRYGSLLVVGTAWLSLVVVMATITGFVYGNWY